MVDCSGLESLCGKSRKTAEIKQICRNSVAHDAMFTNGSSDCAGAEVGTQNAPRSQKHYSEIGFTRVKRLAELTDHTDEELHALFSILAIELGIPDKIPVPPLGLPSFSSTPKSAIMEIIAAGVSYAVAVANGNARSLWHIHDKIDRILVEEWRRGRAYESEAMLAASSIITQQRAISNAENETLSNVYFVQSESGSIKVGMAVDVSARLRSLQTANPSKLKLLATCAGGRTLEREYHSRFAAHRLHGEWFLPHPDILAEIERLASPTQEPII